MITSLRISGSALTAERARLDTIAENIANAQTTRGPDGRAYRRRQVVFETIPEGQARGGGVRVAEIRPSSDPMERVHRPGHPDADRDGYLEMPNVSVVDEMVDMMAASRAYEANVAAVNATKTMIARSLDLGRG